MATIARIKQGGKVVAYKAIIKRRGKILKTKRFKRKAAAQAWAKRQEADAEMMEALGSPGANISFRELGQQYLRYWRSQSKKDRDTPRKVDWWSDRLGDKKLLSIGAAEIRGYLDEFAEGKACRGDGTDRCGKPKRKEIDVYLHPKLTH